MVAALIMQCGFLISSPVSPVAEKTLRTESTPFVSGTEKAIVCRTFEGTNGGAMIV